MAIDGDFGPATGKAVRQFQAKKRLPPNGIVSKRTFAALSRPMARALKPLRRSRRKLGRAVADYARQHLKQHPREIGGQNRGPWVRLYMNGHEGKSWAWCAGFVCFIIRQACKSMEVSLPFAVTYSTSQLRRNAKRKGILLTGAEVAAGKKPSPGAIFLQKGGETGWRHTGIVRRAGTETFRTVEGNTNDEGSAEGYEVCQRTRRYVRKSTGKPGYDFVAFDGLARPPAD